MLRRILSAILTLSALLFVNGLYAQGQITVSNDSYEKALHSWELVLDKHVDSQGRTDFIALSNDVSDLRSFVGFVESTSPTSHPALFNTPEEILAYHLNAYNALAMMGVIDRGIPQNFDNFFKRASFFKFRRVMVGGKKTNLHDYENMIIRPLGDARAHFALNCMVLDCPRLPKTPFRGELLDQQLESASWEFFAKERNLRVDIQKKTIFVSSILDFYTEDFVDSGKAQDLGSYINRYVKNQVPEGFTVKFIKYDWTVNQRPNSTGT